jgi:lysosomal Pro-X carboxypeptidase
LTIENTLIDYVELIKHVKTKFNAENSAVIAFGGSYGGMLAAWMRMKYPHVIQGALAASAPILSFKGNTEAEYNFNNIITKDFAETYPDERCSKGIKKGFEILENLKTREMEWATVTFFLNTCESMNSTQSFENLK